MRLHARGGGYFIQIANYGSGKFPRGKPVVDVTRKLLPNKSCNLLKNFAVNVLMETFFQLHVGTTCVFPHPAKN